MTELVAFQVLGDPPAKGECAAPTSPRPAWDDVADLAVWTDSHPSCPETTTVSPSDPPTLRDPDDAAFVAGWLGERPEDLVELDPDPEISGVAALNALEDELGCVIEFTTRPAGGAGAGGL
jgi:hypothetical protein